MVLLKYILFFLLTNLVYINVGKATPVDYLATAEEMLTAIKNKEDVTIFRKTFELANEDQLAAQLGNDEQKIAFWVNIYNAYIQEILSKNPEKYMIGVFSLKANKYILQAVCSVLQTSNTVSSAGRNMSFF